MIENDLLFKYIFSQEIFLNDLINSLFKYLKKDLTIAFTNINAQEYILPNKRKIKGFYGDIVGILDNEDMISIEIYKNIFSKREYNKSLSYLCRLITNQMHRGNKHYENIKKVIGISFINGNFRKQNERIINEYDFRQRITDKVIDNGILELYLIRLDKVKEIVYTKDEERFIKWLRIITAENIEEIEKIARGDKIMKELKKFVTEWCEESAKDGLQRYIDDREFEAEERGEERGVKLGKKQGITERNKEIAKKMLNHNYNMEEIQDITGLSIRQLEKLT